MIPESKFYTPQVLRSGKTICYPLDPRWVTGDTCTIEPTESGAIITFPGNIKLVATSIRKKDGLPGYMCMKVAAGLLPVCKYRLDRHDDRLEIVWRYEK